MNLSVHNVLLIKAHILFCSKARLVPIKNNSNNNNTIVVVITTTTTTNDKFRLP